MDGIRAAVADGFYRISRGGVEVGGVLFGAREGNLLRILAFRPLACEYASGPSFMLSEKDQEALRRLLETASSDSELEGLVPLGWYHSHTRSEIFLSDQDLEIYDRYFGEPWQISLVLRADKMKPVRGGFFFREQGGSVHTESSYREFILELRPRKKKRVSQAAEKELGGVASVPEPRFFIPPPSRRWADWTLFAVAVFLVLAGAGLITRVYWSPKPERLSLSVLDVAGQLEVRWDPSGRIIREAQGGSLEITDGDKNVRLPMDAGQLRNGSLTYRRQSDAVRFRLRIQRPGAQTEEAVTQFVGESIGPRPPAEELAREVERLRSELQKQSTRNRDLEAALKALRNRLPAERSRTQSPTR
jgi:proteasome lid subunit RPN8/RPN11